MGKEDEEPITFAGVPDALCFLGEMLRGTLCAVFEEQRVRNSAFRHYKVDVDSSGNASLFAHLQIDGVPYVMSVSPSITR